MRPVQRRNRVNVITAVIIGLVLLLFVAPLLWTLLGILGVAIKLGLIVLVVLFVAGVLRRLVRM